MTASVASRSAAATVASITSRAAPAFAEASAEASTEDSRLLTGPGRISIVVLHTRKREKQTSEYAARNKRRAKTRLACDALARGVNTRHKRKPRGRSAGRERDEPVGDEQRVHHQRDAVDVRDGGGEPNLVVHPAGVAHVQRLLRHHVASAAPVQRGPREGGVLAERVDPVVVPVTQLHAERRLLPRGHRRGGEVEEVGVRRHERTGDAPHGEAPEDAEDPPRALEVGVQHLHRVRARLGDVVSDAELAVHDGGDEAPPLHRVDEALHREHIRAGELGPVLEGGGVADGVQEAVAHRDSAVSGDANGNAARKRRPSACALTAQLSTRGEASRDEKC
eukprot:1177819-Prorocentrum_minimum.AAC.2